MQGKAERRLRESRVGPSVVVVVSTGWVVEMVELVDDFAGVWTVYFREMDSADSNPDFKSGFKSILGLTNRA